MERTRIVLIDRPRIFSDLVERLLNDVRQAALVAKLSEPADLVAAIDEADAELVIVCAPSIEGRELLELITARPRLKALAVVGDGEGATLYELLPHRTLLGDVSAETLRAAIRIARTPRTVWTSAPEPLS